MNHSGRTVHNLFNVERHQLRYIPMWITDFLHQVQVRPHASKPSVLLVTEFDGGIEVSDAVVVVRLSDLLELVRAYDHPMETDTPHAVYSQE